MKRAIILILDGLGCGALADANEYHDFGTNTISHITQEIGEINIPNMEKIGFGKISSVKRIKPVKNYCGAYGKMCEKSLGKDSVTGHWEIAGLHLKKAFPVFEYFPMEILTPFIQKCKRGVIGNKAASGTEIIKELGEEHIKTGKLIVYTSADSVFQIAAHEDIVPIDELYYYCEIARKILRGKNEVGRVIARPFTGKDSTDFARTKYRKDFSVFPPKDTIFDILLKNDINTVGIGKIDDLFAGRGIKSAIKSKGNRACMKSTIEVMDKFKSAFIMTNFVDFDMQFGHQRNVRGYFDELELFDKELSEILNKMTNEDILILSSDHGNDPTHTGTDHTREYVPLLVYHKKMENSVNLGIRSSFSDIAKTLLDYFDLQSDAIHGESFYSKLYE